MNKKQIATVAMVILTAVAGMEVLDKYYPRVYNSIMFVIVGILGLGILAAILIYFWCEIKKNNRAFAIKNGISEKN